MKLPAVLALSFALVPLGACAKSPSSYSQDIQPVSSPGSVERPATGEVRITYLGVNGYLLESRDSAILIDPYFSRHPLRRTGRNAKIQPNESRISEGLAKARLPQKVDAILVTHGHLDHLMDVPFIQKTLGSPIIASPTSCHLAHASGVAASALNPVLPGTVVQAGAATIEIVKGHHGDLFGKVPFPGTLTAPPSETPLRPGDWICGTPLAFRIKIAGREIFIENGGSPGPISEAARGVDLAIVGAALKPNRARFHQMAEGSDAKYILPSHQDNMFQPARKGFHFSVVSDFKALLKTHQATTSDHQSQLILMDYFSPWLLGQE